MLFLSPRFEDERTGLRRHIPGGDDCPGKPHGWPGLSHFLVEILRVGLQRLAVGNALRGVRAYAASGTAQRPFPTDRETLSVL